MAASNKTLKIQVDVVTTGQPQLAALQTQLAAEKTAVAAVATQDVAAAASTQAATAAVVASTDAHAALNPVLSENLTAMLSQGIAAETAAKAAKALAASTVSLTAEEGAAIASRKALAEAWNSGAVEIAGFSEAQNVAIAGSKKFTITTEAEYLAIKKAHAAMATRITVLAAAGGDVTKLTAAQTALSESLSTENALLVAERMEQKAVAAAALEKAAADDIATTAVANHSAGLNGLSAMADELMRGNYSRIPASASAMARRMGLLKYILSPMGAAFIATAGGAYLLYKEIKDLNAELDAQAEWDAQPLVDKWTQIQKAIVSAQQDVAKFETTLANAGKDGDPLGTQFANDKKLLDAEIESEKKLLAVKLKVEAAEIRAIGGPDMQKKLDALAAQGDAAGTSLDEKQSAGELALKYNELYARKNNQAALHQESLSGADAAALATQDKNDRASRMNEYPTEWGTTGTKTFELKADELAGQREAKSAAWWAKYFGWSIVGAIPAVVKGVHTMNDYQKIKDLDNQKAIVTAVHSSDLAHGGTENEKDDKIIAAHAAAESADRDNSKRIGVLERELPTDHKIYDLNRQTDAQAKAGDQTDAAYKQFSDDEESIRRDIATIQSYSNHKSQTRDEMAKTVVAVKEMRTTLEQANATFREIAAMGQNVSGIRSELAALKAQVRGLNHAGG